MAIYINKGNKIDELNRINLLSAEIDALLQDPSIDQSIKELVLLDLALTQDTIQKDAMSPANARQYKLGVYDGIKQKFAGLLGYSPSLVGSAVLDWRGRYTPDEINWMVNETLKHSAVSPSLDFYTPTYDIPAQTGKTVYVFNPAGDNAKIYKIANGTPNKVDSIKSFASYLLNQLTSVQKALGNKDITVHGWEGPDDLSEWIQLLSTAGLGSEELLNSLIIQMGSIINTLKNSNLLNMYEDNFLYWLEGFAPEKKQETPNKAGTIKIGEVETPIVQYDNEHAAELMASKGWKVVKEGDKYAAYLTGGDGLVRPVKNLQIVVIDPTDRETWKKAVITDENGVISYGDLGSDDFVRTLSPSRWLEIQQYIKDAHTQHFGAVLKLIDKGLGRYVDLSNFFTGSDPVIYQLGDDESTDPLWYDWDAIGNTDKFVFAGNTDATASGASVDDLFLRAAGDPGDISLIETFTEEMASDRFGGNSNSTGDINTKRWWADPTFKDNLVYEPNHLSDAIVLFMYNLIKLSKVIRSEDVNKDTKIQEILSALLQLCPNYTKNVRPSGGEGKKQLGDVMKDTILNDLNVYKSILKSILLNPNMQDVRTEVVELLLKLVTSNKQGGILKAFEGATLADETVNQQKRNNDVGGAMNIEKQDLDPNLDADTIKGRRLLAASAIIDFLDVVTPNSNRKAGRWISPVLNGISLGNDIAASQYLDMTPGQKAILLGSDVAGTALSFIPFIDKIDKIERFLTANALKKLHIAMGGIGIGAGSIGMIFSTPDALKAAQKLWDGRTEELTAADLHALATWATSVATGTKGVGNIAYGMRSNPIKKSPELIYVDAIDALGNRTAKPVRQADYEAALEKGNEEAKKLWFGKRKKRKLTIESELNIGKINTNWRGIPRTKPSLEYDLEGLVKLGGYQALQHPLKPSVIEKPGTFSLKDEPYFGLWKNFKWEWNPFKKLAGVNPVAYKRIVKDDKTYTAIGVASLDDYKNAIKEFLPGKPSEISDVTLHGILGPMHVPAGTKASESGLVIVYMVPSPTATVNRAGGKVQRLNQFINKH